MGISWIMEIVSAISKNVVPEYYFTFTDLILSLQGVLIFNVFICKKRVKNLLLKRFAWLDMNNFISRNLTQSTATNQENDLVLSSVTHTSNIN